jgi:nucleotide-binding universal stress UspA family protein
MKLERIAVGVDGPDNSVAAVEWAAGLAAAVGAEVVAVHALGLLERLEPGTEKVPSAGHRPEVEERLTTVWTAAFDARGVPCRRIVRDGPSVEVLLAVAEEVGADLVVVGSRGLGGYPEQLLGSTSTQVAQRSDVPVVIVPHG